MLQGTSFHFDKFSSNSSWVALCFYVVLGFSLPTFFFKFTPLNLQLNQLAPFLSFFITRVLMRLFATVFCGIAAVSAQPQDGEAPSKETILATASAAADAPNSASSTVFFQNFNGDDVDKSFVLSSFADYVGQDINVRAVEGRCVCVASVCVREKTFFTS